MKSKSFFNNCNLVADVKVAVYGTLRSDHRDFHSTSEKGEMGRIHNATLYFPGLYHFPAVVIDGKESSVRVEVMTIDKEKLARWDRYEGIDSGLYERKSCNVELDNGEEIFGVQIYVAGESLMRNFDQFELVPEGDWMKRSQMRQE